jgi:hypothetical protein
MTLGSQQEVPSVDRRDYRIRITGVASHSTDDALMKCGALAQSGENFVKVQHYPGSTIVHFYATCEPLFVDDVADALMKALCPEINDGLLEAFLEPQEELLAATA